MKISQKLAVGFGGTLFFLGIIVILVIKLDNKVREASNETIYGIVQEAKEAGQVFSSIQTIQKLNQDLLLEKLIDSEANQALQVNRNEINLELKKLEQNIIASQRATIEQKSMIHSANETTLSRKRVKISGEEDEIVKMTKLLAEIQNYQRDWQLFLERKDANGSESSLYSIQTFTRRMNQVIFPLVKECYEDSLEEIIESELTIQQLSSENLTIIKSYALFTFIFVALLFIYIYRSIYTSIKYAKLATFHLGLNVSEYQPIQPINPDDEIGALIKYFNHTVETLKRKIISKSYLDSIINSLEQSLIILDNENKIERINRNTVETLSYSESELIGKSITDIVVPDSSLEIDELMSLDNLSSNYFTIDLLTKKLEKISFTVYFSDLCDSEGKKQGTICLAIPTDQINLSNIVNFSKKQKKYRNNLN